MAVNEIVSIVRVDESGIENAVRQAIDLSGGLAGIVKPDSRVLIKPNLFRPEPSGRGLTTDCRVTEAVAKVILEQGPESVVIGEGSGAGYDFGGSHSTEEAFRVSGTADVARRLGIELCNLNRDAFVEVKIDNPYVMDRVRVARTALESDVIISVPVLKTHNRTLVTLSLKNMKGVMPGAEKRKSHRLGLDKAIADLNSVVRPSFVVVDGLAGMQGLWDYPQDRFELGLVMAGRDPVVVDTAGTYLMGFDPAQVMHLQYFARRQRTPADLSRIEVVGEAIEEHRQSLKSGFQVVKSRYPGVTIIEGESACTGCTGELIGVLAAIKRAGYEQALEALTIIMGNPSTPSTTTRTVVLGKCTRRLANLGCHVKGCPPHDDDMIKAICKVCGIDAEFIIASRNQAREKMWAETKALLEE
ncbi:hypothetical protein ES703_33034 [subsurface metagenome]